MFLLFDIGGTTTRMAISQTGDKLDDVKLFPTNHNFSEAMEKMHQVSDEFSNGETFHAVLGGVRSYDRQTGTLFHQPNFPLWGGEPLLATMREMWGKDVFLENDAVMVGLGEAIYGAGKGFDIVAYVTLSTGVGGCRINRGSVDDTEFSFEPGNMLVAGRNGTPVCLEQVISGSAIELYYGKNPFELESDQAWEEITEQVGIGLNNVVVMWSPQILVLGGSVAQKINFDKVNLYLKKYCKIYPKLPTVVKATLDEEGGLYGGLAKLKKLP